MPETPDQWKGFLLFAALVALYVWAFVLPLIPRLKRWARRKLRQFWAKSRGAEFYLWPKVLVADDEPHLVRFLQDHLEDAGYRVVTSSRTEEVLDAARSEEPDLIILEVYMPAAHSACSAIQSLLSDRRTADIPIILMKARQPYIEPGCERPICCHRPQTVSSFPMVHKPFNPMELLALVDRLLRDGSPRRRSDEAQEPPA